MKVFELNKNKIIKLPKPGILTITWEFVTAVEENHLDIVYSAKRIILPDFVISMERKKKIFTFQGRQILKCQISMPNL